jgi:hypothetical protein
MSDRLRQGILAAGGLARKIEIIEPDQTDLPCPVPSGKIF